MIEKTHTRTVPSPEARLLFGTMVARSDSMMFLSLSETMALAADRAGEDDKQSINELRAAGWISQAPDGGWSIDGVVC